MPAKSKAQQRLMAMAATTPEKIFPENTDVLDMSKGQLDDFARTDLAGLPTRIGGRSKNALSSPKGLLGIGLGKRRRKSMSLGKLKGLKGLEKL